MIKTDGSFGLLIKYVRGHILRILVLAVIFVVSSALFILAPQFLSQFIDKAQSGGAAGAAIVIYLISIFFRAAASALLEFYLATTGQLITDEFRHDVMAHYLKLDAMVLTASTPGDVMTRLDEDVQGLFNYYYILLFKLTGSAITLIGILCVLVSRSGLLCACLFLVSMLSVLGFKIIQDKGIPKYVRQSAVSALFNGKMKEVLDNAAALRALSAEAYARDRIDTAMTVRYRESIPANLMYGHLWSAATVMQGAITATGLVFALLLWDKGLVSPGMAYLIYVYCNMVTEPLQDFRNHMGEMQKHRAGILRTLQLLHMPVRAGGYMTLPAGALSVEISGLDFAYGSKPALRNVNLCVAAGKRLGIMGETGCGKSTLLGILAALNEYTTGSVRLGGVEISRVSESVLRSRVAYIAQKPQLIHGTIRDNVTFFDTAYTDADIFSAIASLNLSEWFAKFAYGLDTKLEMGEDSLSSGEAQLIALIRLALREPGLILLDEITASIDADTEARVTRAVAALCRGCTVIAIAHRAEALNWMDEIVLMQDGRLAAFNDSIA